MKLENKKVLVTGGAGFIGSHVVDLLIREGGKVTILDDLRSGSKDNVNPQAHLIESPIESYMSDDHFDIVFHLAATTDLNLSIENPLNTTWNNLMNTIRMLEVARQAHAERFVFSSSCAVYGTQDSVTLTEDMTPHPETPYALQKLHGEQWCQMYEALYGLRCTSLRYFNVYGRRMSYKGGEGAVVAKFVQSRREGKPMTIYGTGEQTRSYVHVTDVAYANIQAATSDHTGVFNIGTDMETSVNQLAELLGGKVQYLENPRKHDAQRVNADIHKAHEQLGWQPQVPLGAGLLDLQVTL